MKKVLFSLVLCLIFSAAVLSFPAAAASPAPDVTHVESVCLYNVENDYVLYEKNAERPVSPASTAKILTAVLALEAYAGDLDQIVAVPAEALRDVRGNNIDLEAGEHLSVRDLIAAVTVGGANDAASALAVLVAGDEASFCEAMDRKAASLGATSTHYKNPSGLDADGASTTAADTVKIAAYAYNVPGYLELCGATSYYIDATDKSPARSLYTKNYLLSGRSVRGYYYEYANGMNAGSTAGAGYCLAASATHDGLTYLLTIFGAEQTEEEDGSTVWWSFENADRLFDWAFDGFGYVRLVDTASMVCEMAVEDGMGVDYVTLLPGQKLDVFLPLDVDIENEVSRTWYTAGESVTAPVSEGQVLGKMTLTYEGKILGEVDLVAKNSVSVSYGQKIWSTAKRFLRSGLFRVILWSAAIAGVIYVFLMAYFRGKRKGK